MLSRGFHKKWWNGSDWVHARRCKSLFIYLNKREYKKYENYQYEDEEKSRPRSEILRHLIDFGRTHNREPLKLPQWAQRGAREVTSMRTSAQLKRSLAKPFFNTSGEAQARYRERPIGWLIRAPKYTHKTNIYGERSRPSQLIYGPEESITYTRYYMPGRFAHIHRVFGDVKRMMPNWHPRTMLDFGCGPGTALVAAADIWSIMESKSESKFQHELDDTYISNSGSSRDSVSNNNDCDTTSLDKYVGIDMSRSMIDVAKTIASGLSTVDCTFWEDTTSVVTRAVRRGERFDLVVASYTLSELGDDSQRVKAVQLLYELLSPEGVIVFIEVGTPQGSHIVRSARQMLLGMEDANGAKVTAVAPCTHDGECPLALGFWCSFTQLVTDEAAMNDKYSYIALRKTPKREKRKKQEDNEDNTDKEKASLVQRLVDRDNQDTRNLSLLYETKRERKKIIREDWARVVRSPIKNRGHVVMDVCTPQGRLERMVFSRSNTINTLYGAVRRTRWGGLTPASIVRDGANHCSHYDNTKGRSSPLVVSPKGTSLSVFDVLSDHHQKEEEEATNRYLDPKRHVTERKYKQKFRLKDEGKQLSGLPQEMKKIGIDMAHVKSKTHNGGESQMEREPGKRRANRSPRRARNSLLRRPQSDTD